MSPFDLEETIRQKRLKRLQDQQHREHKLKNNPSPAYLSSPPLPEQSSLLERTAPRWKADTMSPHCYDRRQRQPDLPVSTVLQLQRDRRLHHQSMPDDRVQTLLENHRRRTESLEKEEVLLRAIEQQSRKLAIQGATYNGAEEDTAAALQHEVLKTNDEISQGEQRIRLLKRELLREEQGLMELIQRRRDLVTAGHRGEHNDFRSRFVSRDAPLLPTHLLDKHPQQQLHDRGTSTLQLAIAPRRRDPNGMDADHSRAKRFKTDTTTAFDVEDTAPTESPSNVSSTEKRTARLLNDDARTVSSSSTTTHTPQTDGETIPLTTNAETEGISLAIPSDNGLISSYQSLVRTSLEFFTAKEDDVASSAKGRKKEIFPGQVGVRCKFCANRPNHWKGRGSTYYPGKLWGVYQAAQNMAVTHLLENCCEIPDDVKKTLGEERRNQRIMDRRGGGKKYWMESCHKMGLREHDGKPGLFWATGCPHG